MLVAVVTSNAAVRAAIPWLVPGVDARYLDPADPGTLPADTDVVVIDVGSTDDGMALVEHLRSQETSDVSTPAIVIGDDPAEVAGDIEVIVRPVDLEELRLRLEILRPASEVAASAEREPPSGGLARLLQRVGIRGRSGTGDAGVTRPTPLARDPAGPTTPEPPLPGSSAGVRAVESPAGPDEATAPEHVDTAAAVDEPATEQEAGVQTVAVRGQAARHEADEYAPPHDDGTDPARDVGAPRAPGEGGRPSETADQTDDLLSPADGERQGSIHPLPSEDAPVRQGDRDEQADSADGRGTGAQREVTGDPQASSQEAAASTRPDPSTTIDETMEPDSSREVARPAAALVEGAGREARNREEVRGSGGPLTDDVVAEDVSDGGLGSEADAADVSSQDVPDGGLGLEADATDRGVSAAPESAESRDDESPTRAEDARPRRRPTSSVASLRGWLRSVAPDRSRSGAAPSSRVEDLLGRIDDLPALGDPRAVGRAIASELRDRGAAGPIAILLRGNEGFRTIGGLDLTGAQARAVVPADHPLVELLEERVGGLLLLEGLHGGTALVRGVPVAHADTTTVIPLHDREGLMAIAVIGGVGGRPPQLIAAMEEARDYLTVLTVVGDDSARIR